MQREAELEPEDAFRRRRTDHRAEALGPAVARVRSADGTPVGSGFLLAPGTVVTCAHVVAQALRTDARAESAPTGPVTVEFPLQRGSVAYEASVTAWQPVAADGTGDIAPLRLPEQSSPEEPVPVPWRAPATSGTTASGSWPSPPRPNTAPGSADGCSAPSDRAGSPWRRTAPRTTSRRGAAGLPSGTSPSVR
ncbi:trypsin-like peptidase domain-containing protein [Streptomyces tuirus]|uniref:Trypsin-like peptidase domain-containing protein n=1 Tax=Streptomyces tuirus TaxID=68278 RepID=A0A941FD15_9ACTN|nr:trypsin-like peptidase domain-containing protein [Streptomyces tuirus]